MTNIKPLPFVIFPIIFWQCREPMISEKNDSFSLFQSVAKEEKTSLIDSTGHNIQTRFLPPPSSKRIAVDSGSFGFYLRHLSLKSHGATVLYYNGSEKNKPNVYCGVIDMPISKRDLQQCADAVMRLKAEYHFEKKQYRNIHFNFLSDGKARYFSDYAKGDFSQTNFMKYMDYIMAFANTSSLKDELVSVNWNQMQIGDVLIQKGNPYGHAVLVVDMAKNTRGKKFFLLAQSYMPAQETQVLINPMDDEISPWYELKEGPIITPEWEFHSSDLEQFKD